MGYRWENVQCDLLSTQLLSTSSNVRRVPTSEFWTSNSLTGGQTTRLEIRARHCQSDSIRILRRCQRCLSGVDRLHSRSSEFFRRTRPQSDQWSRNARFLVDSSDRHTIRSKSPEPVDALLPFPLVDWFGTNQTKVPRDVQTFLGRRCRWRYIGRLQTTSPRHCQVTSTFIHGQCARVGEEEDCFCSVYQ